VCKAARNKCCPCARRPVTGVARVQGGAHRLSKAGPTNGSGGAHRGTKRNGALGRPAEQPGTAQLTKSRRRPPAGGPACQRLQAHARITQHHRSGVSSSGSTRRVASSRGGRRAFGGLADDEGAAHGINSARGGTAGMGGERDMQLKMEQGC